jgi:hypothetical protein
MRVVGWLAGIGTFLAATMYMVVSLNRWEWNRALFFGLLMLIAEVGLATGLVLRRLTRMEYKLVGVPDDGSADVRQVLAETRREATPNRFAWLAERAPGRDLNVFITFLVGGGVLISGIAWVVDRIASKTSSPIAEQRLAHELRAIAYPPGGLLLDDVTVLAQEVPGADDAQIRQLLRRGGTA